MEEINFRKNKMNLMISSYKDRINRKSNKSRILELDDDDLSDLDSKFEDVHFGESKPENLTISVSKITNDRNKLQNLSIDESKQQILNEKNPDEKEIELNEDIERNESFSDTKENLHKLDEEENEEVLTSEDEFEKETDSSQSSKISKSDQKSTKEDSQTNVRMESLKMETKDITEKERPNDIFSMTSNNEETPIENDPNDFKVIKIEEIENFLFQPIFTSSIKFKCQLKRDNGGLERSLFPVYVLHHENNNGKKYLLMAARKRKTTLKSSYILSTDPICLHKSESSYIGKIKSNLICSKFTLFDSEESEQTVVYYDYSIFGFNGPRKIKVKIPKISKTKDITNFTEIDNFVSKLPEWDEDMKSYVLNFNGRSKIASIKNIQLVRPDNDEEIILQLGKVDENTFSLDFVYPFSPVQAFCIGLSCLASKVSK